MAVELEDMRWALIASRHRSLRRAAAAANARQSTFSRRMRHLERLLGVELFERNTAGIRLTPAGEHFVLVAQSIVENVDVAFAQLRSWGRGDGGRLILGVCIAFSAGNLRATLQEHSMHHADVEIQLVDGPRSQLLADLAAGMIDIAVMTEKGTAWPGRTLPLWSERVVVALPQADPLCHLPVIHWTDLLGARVLTTRRDPGPYYEAMLRNHIGDGNLCNFLRHNVSLDRLLGLVGAGLGPTLISEGATGASYEGVRYRELHDEGGPVRVSFSAYWRENNRNPALAAFLTLLHRRYPDLSPSSAPT